MPPNAKKKLIEKMFEATLFTMVDTKGILMEKIILLSVKSICLEL